MFILRFKKVFYIFSLLLVIASLFGLARWGLNLGIDFTGGTLLEVQFSTSIPPTSDIRSAILDAGAGIKDIVVQPSSNNSVLLKFNEIDSDGHTKITNAITALAQKTNQTATEKSFETIGPAIGQELRQRAIYAIAVTLIGILLFISFAFRKVSRPISSFHYALMAVIALFHDVIISLGVFSFLGHFAGITIDLPFVAAILTVLGYSVNDTIVVFDRIRENLLRGVGKEFSETVGISIGQTFVRSLATSATVFIALLAIYFLGGSSTQSFALALIVGIFFGTYSSIFIASPLLVSWYTRIAKSRKTAR